MNKKLWALLSIALLVPALFFGCAKPPQAEIDAAKAAIDKAKADGAEMFAETEMTAAQEALKAALAEVDKQKDKLFPDYVEARKLLADAIIQAGEAKVNALPGREKARTEAEEALARADAVIKDVKELLARKSRGRRKSEKIKTLKDELAEASGSADEVRRTLKEGDYVGARADAVTALMKAQEVKDKLVPRAKKGPLRRRR
jgi:hypothetical protein